MHKTENVIRKLIKPSHLKWKRKQAKVDDLNSSSSKSEGGGSSISDKEFDWLFFRYYDW